MLRENGFFLMIIQDGEGINEKYSNLVVDGKSLRRLIYCYTKNYLSGITHKILLEFVKEGYLDKTLVEHNWRNYIFKKGKIECD
jgi:hypothetical protein